MFISCLIWFVLETISSAFNKTKYIVDITIGNEVKRATKCSIYKIKSKEEIDKKYYMHQLMCRPERKYVMSVEYHVLLLYPECVKCHQPMMTFFVNI